MRNWGLLAGLAAILAGLVLAGGESIVTDKGRRANAALVHDATPPSPWGTPSGSGFFAGAGVTSAL